MIRLQELCVRAGAFRLRDVSVEVPRGTWSIVLGPTGAGKTTLLEAIAGVRRAESGGVALRGVDVTAQPAEGRRVGIVYQRGYLFPHLSVEDNVRYGTRDAAYADQLMERFGAKALRERTVAALSGGERQVVALLRALAPRPDILLLDEPFAALDPRRRTVVRRELQLLQRELGVTVLQVTHDFAEAGTLGDLALLMDEGRLVQVAPPELLFRRPATPAAAEFLGAENIFAGQVREAVHGEPDGPDALLFDAGAFTLAAIGSAAPGQAHAVIRGEDVTLSREVPSRGSARNVLPATVVEVASHGVVARVTLDVRGLPLVAVVTAAAVAELGVVAGVHLSASVKATAVHLC